MRYKIDVVPCKREEVRKRLYLTRYSCPASDPHTLKCTPF